MKSNDKQGKQRGNTVTVQGVEVSTDTLQGYIDDLQEQEGRVAASVAVGLVELAAIRHRIELELDKIGGADQHLVLTGLIETLAERLTDALAKLTVAHGVEREAVSNTIVAIQAQLRYERVRIQEAAASADSATKH